MPIRLLNTRTLKLETFPPNAIPPYAILSHTWETKEVSYQEWTSLLQRQLSRHKANKIIQTCRLAREHQLEYAWIDTCCIDKTNNTELSEAINSMYRWYQQASICFVYLSDMSGSTNFESGLQTCRWLKRGWTLQELIAPTDVEFYNASWKSCGTRAQYHRLLADCTGIAHAVLSGQQKLEAYSVTTRMNWAYSRQTTLPEDSAYCLLGIFGVNMPLIYGEGFNAFHRLEEAVRRRHQHMSTLSYVSTNDQISSASDLYTRYPPRYSPRVPPELSQSYRNWVQYPSNLLDKTAHASRMPTTPGLADELTRPCDELTRLPQIVFGDLHTNQRSYQYTVIRSESELAVLLGDQSNSAYAGDCMTKEDPKGRVIFLTLCPASKSILSSRQMLQRVLSYHQVPVQYLNMLWSMSQLRPPSVIEQESFWSRQSLSNRVPGLDAPDLGRSGCHYEMAFVLKGVETVGPAGFPQENHWSVRSAAIYHKFDIVHESSLWFLGKTESTFQDQFDETWDCRKYGSSSPATGVAASFIATLESHLLLARWANESWLGYLKFLETAVTDETQRFVRSLIKPSADDLYKVQTIKDQIEEALAAINANHHVVQALVTFYDGLFHSSEFAIGHDVKAAFDDFSIQVRNNSQITQSTTSRANHLLEYTRERINLMLQIMLATISESNKSIAMTSKSTDYVVRMLSLLTIIFLPATFVSTFFSVSFMDFKSDVPIVEHIATTSWTTWVIRTVVYMLAAVGVTATYYWFVQRRRAQQRDHNASDRPTKMIHGQKLGLKTQSRNRKQFL